MRATCSVLSRRGTGLPHREGRAGQGVHQQAYCTAPAWPRGRNHHALCTTCGAPQEGIDIYSLEGCGESQSSGPQLAPVGVASAMLRRGLDPATVSCSITESTARSALRWIASCVLPPMGYWTHVTCASSSPSICAW